MAGKISRAEAQTLAHQLDTLAEQNAAALGSAGAGKPAKFLVDDMRQRGLVDKKGKIVSGGDANEKAYKAHLAMKRTGAVPKKDDAKETAALQARLAKYYGGLDGPAPGLTLSDPPSLHGPAGGIPVTIRTVGRGTGKADTGRPGDGARLAAGNRHVATAARTRVASLDVVDKGAAAHRGRIVDMDRTGRETRLAASRGPKVPGDDAPTYAAVTREARFAPKTDEVKTFKADNGKVYQWGDPMALFDGAQVPWGTR